jgi:hypothetical protein
MITLYLPLFFGFNLAYFAPSLNPICFELLAKCYYISALECLEETEKYLD